MPFFVGYNETLNFRNNIQRFYGIKYLEVCKLYLCTVVHID